MHDYSRMTPQATPETKPYWDGLKSGKLMIQRNKQTGKAYFPPRPFDPADPFAEVEWFEASGKGKLLSYVISHRAMPGYETPFAIAVVELDEGGKMMTNIIDCPQTPEALQLDMRLELAPHKVNDEITLPLWRPAKGA
ncbi:MAG TPA: Zn-ribbon domain-containing OB-fold protein [Tepidiformaceae bacterium]|nr:Zn-ribbon domain-containing OB-fold protein [Tepidiformaceae bacterium]